MRTNKKTLRVEALELRDVPAMLVPVLDPGVTVATPDHWHAAREVAVVAPQLDPAMEQARIKIPSLSSSSAEPTTVRTAVATSRAAMIGPILDVPMAAGKVAMQDMQSWW